MSKIHLMSLAILMLLLVATVVLAINFLVDLSYTKIDPRVSYAH